MDEGLDFYCEVRIMLSPVSLGDMSFSCIVYGCGELLVESVYVMGVWGIRDVGVIENL